MRNDKRGFQAINEKERKKIIALRRDTGLSYRAIAERFGCTQDTVHNICDIAGLPRMRAEHNKF